MTRFLAMVLAGCGLVACSTPPSGSKCAQNSDCPGEAICASGVCQKALQTSITSGPQSLISSSSATFQFESPDVIDGFECKLDTEPSFTPCASPASYTGMHDGERTFQVRARDAAGDLDPTPATWSWTIDTTPPDAKITATPSSPIASSSATFQFGSSDAKASFECKLDNEASFTPCASPTSYSGLPDGTRTFQVRARDPVGNLNPVPTAWTWTIDTTAPDTLILSSPGSPMASASATFRFGSSDPTASFECKLDTQTSFTSCTSPASYSGLPDGERMFQVRARDPLGNVNPAPAAWTWTVDTTAPGVVITSSPSSPVASSTATFQFSSTEATATFECRLDTQASFTPCTSPASYSAVPDGSRTFQVRAKDPLGNVTPTPAARTWVVDTTGPDTALTSFPASPQSENPSFSFTSPEAGAIFECAIDSTSTFAPCTSPRAYSGLSIGLHTFRVRAKDALGNVDATPATLSWTQAPETTITWAPLSATNRATEKVAFSSPASSATFECALDSGTYSACTSPKAFPGLASGSHTVSVRAVSGTIADPSPATATFSVFPQTPLLYYNFENSGANGGVLSGFGAVLSGAAAYSCLRSHSATGLCSLRFSATDPPLSNRGSATLPGVRNVLSHDHDASDARYTIAFWYWEDTPINVAVVVPDNFFPTVFDTRSGAGGFETYHGVSTPPLWTTCWSSTPSGGTCVSGNDPVGATWHRMSIEHAFNSSTGAFDLKVYVDGSLLAVTSPVVGATIFNATQADPVLGNDWRGNMDDLKIFNETYGGNPP